MGFKHNIMWCKAMIPERGETNEMSPATAQTYIFESFQATVRGNPGKALGFLELNRQTQEIGEAKAARIHRAECQRGKSCTKKKFWIIVKGSLQVVG